MRATIVFVSLCALLTAAGLYQVQAAYWDTSIGDGLVILVGAVLAAILFFKAFFWALQNPAPATGRRLMPLFFWLGSVGVVAVYERWLNRIEYAPDFMHVSSGSDFSINGFTLKKDGRYIYWNGSGLGESRNYGTYTQHDSIIVLQPDSPRNAPRQTRLLIRPYPFTSPQKSRLYLLNGNGLIAKFDAGYQIVELAVN